MPKPDPKSKLGAEEAPPNKAEAEPTKEEQVRAATKRVPDRPKLANEADLVGQMEDSAYVDPPFLVQQADFGYVQVSETLHETAAAADGKRTVKQIATKVTKETGEKVTPTEVKELLATELIPTGIVERQDGSVTKPDGDGRGPLEANLNMVKVGPEVFAPAANVLQHLFWPPIVVAVLVAAAIAQGWLFFVHGIAESARQTVDAPFLILVLIGAAVLDAAFHELGHAAALRYGGAAARSMGAGFYLVWPAFYTDVTDGYRLGRWARVRTDLGGFYFNFIFILGVIGLYFVTRQEVLLLIVPLVNLTVVRQMLPFLRLDGYWLLADITGIPDFLSQMGAFLRAKLPWRKGSGDGDELPELKPWAQRVFWAYIGVTIPAIGVLVFVMLRSLPPLLATAWASAGDRFGVIETSFSRGDIVTVVSALAQIMLLLLPVVGFGLVFANLGKGFGKKAWKWVQADPRRRPIGALGAAGAAAVLALVLWQAPLGIPAPFVPIAADTRGTACDLLPPPVECAPLLATAEENTGSTPVEPEVSEGSAVPVVAGSEAPAEPAAAPIQAPVAPPPAAPPAAPAAAPQPTAAPIVSIAPIAPTAAPALPTVQPTILPLVPNLAPSAAPAITDPTAPTLQVPTSPTDPVPGVPTILP